VLGVTYIVYKRHSDLYTLVRVYIKQMKRTYLTLIKIFLFITILGCSSKEVTTEGAMSKNSGELQVDGQPVANQLSSPTPKDLMFEAEPERLIPEEVLPFITSPYKVYRFVEGDLNGDKLQDYIVVLVNTADLEEYNEEAKLPVLLLTRQKNNQLELSQKHEELLPYEYVAYSSTHSADIAIGSTGPGFTVTYRVQGGTASGVWQESRVYFTYSKKQKDWLLESIVTAGGANSPGYWLEKEAIREAEERGDTAFLRRIEEEGFPFEEMEEELSNSEGDSYTTLTAKDFGIITLSKFEMGDWIFEF
jgi:hypothetical protein